MNAAKFIEGLPVLLFLGKLLKFNLMNNWLTAGFKGECDLAIARSRGLVGAKSKAIF